MLAGLFFLLLLLLVFPPPELMVLPPDIFLFRRLLGCCRAGSAGGGGRHSQSQWEGVSALQPLVCNDMPPRAASPPSFPAVASPSPQHRDRRGSRLPDSMLPASQDKARDGLWVREKPVPRTGPDQKALETRRQQGRQRETHQAERPSAATSGRGKS